MRAFGWWTMTGFALAFAVLGALSIGVFFVPVVIVAAVLARRSGEAVSAFGLVVGMGLTVLVVAFLNRGSGDLDGGAWALVGSVLIVAGVVAYLTARTRGS